MIKRSAQMRMVLAAGITLFGSVATLACPSGDDALAGLELIYTDGTHSTITRAPDGAVTEIEDPGDGTINTYIAELGIFESAYTDSGTSETDYFTYSFDVPTPRTFAPWTGGQGEQVTQDSAKTEINRVPFTWSSRGRETRTIAGCEYEAIPFQTIYHNPEGPTAVEFLWLPDLGVSINMGFSEFSNTTPYVPEIFRKRTE